MKNNKDNRVLFKLNQKEYGPEYKEHFFRQYQLYIEGIEKISDRRQNANNYFITINTVLITLIGLILQLKIFYIFTWIKPLFAFIGIIICLIFWFLIRSYKQLNTGKFKVIHEIEQHLPLALYDYEWKILEEGKNKNVYYPFSHIEMLIPWIFGLIYAALGIVWLIYK